MGCKVQQRAAAVVPLQAQAEEELPRLLQTLLQPVRQAVERAVVPYLAAPVRRVDRPVAEVAVADPGTSGLRTSHTPRDGSGELLLAWRCEVDKVR